MTNPRIGAYEIRRAEPFDVAEIALAHRDSIQCIGPAFYPPEIVAYWQEAITGELYLKAMDAGEVFFIAVGEADAVGVVLGFASDYRIDGPKHGTSVYVRGRSARRGIGSALLARAEAHAVSQRRNEYRDRSVASWRGLLPGQWVHRGETWRNAPDDRPYDGVRIHAQEFAAISP
jgi:GNAT superfamily N-acetyltransferase